MFVDNSNIKYYVDMLLALPLFNDIDKREELKRFLTDVLTELYKTYPEDIENVFKNTFNVNYITYAFATSFGILPKDVVKALKYFIHDTISLFIKKGSFNNVIYLKKLLIPFGISVDIYTVHMINNDHYEGYEIDSNYNIVFDPDEDMNTSIHLICKRTYQRLLREHNYKTIVLHINISNNVYFDKDTLSPPVALQAYAFTRYKNESIIAYFNDKSVYFHMTVLEFMKLFRYLYLKYLQANNPGFDVNNTPVTEMWFMVFDADQYLDDLYDLCDDYLHHIYDRRSLDEYIRREAAFMNLNKIIVGGHSIEFIRNSLYSSLPQVLDYIESLNPTADDYYNFLNEMRESLITKLLALTYANDIEEAAFKVFLYLINTVVFDVKYIKTQVDDIFHVFKKYFLPIYTTHKTKVDYIASIKNRLFKLYTTSEITDMLIFPYESLIDLQDDQDIRTDVNQEDLVLSVDSTTPTTTPQWYEKVSLNEVFEAYFAMSYGGDLVETFDYQDIFQNLSDKYNIEIEDQAEDRSIIRDFDIDEVEIDSVALLNYFHEIKEVVLGTSDKYNKKFYLRTIDNVFDNISDNGTITVYNADNSVKETDTF